MPVPQSSNSQEVLASPPPGKTMSLTGDCKGLGPVTDNSISTQIAIEDNKQQEPIKVKTGTYQKQKPIPRALMIEEPNIYQIDGFRNNMVKSQSFIPQFQNTNNDNASRVKNYDIQENKAVVSNNQVQKGHVFQETEKQQRNVSLEAEHQVVG